MNPQLQTMNGVLSTAISLQQLVSDLVENSLPAASHNNTLVLNEVRQGIALGSSTQRAVDVMNELLFTIVVNSRNGDIHITADRYHDVVTLEIQERNNYNGYALAYSITSMETDAARLGGHITIKDSGKKIATILFSFPDNLQAA
jgi:hypothetical protein